ncbi:MAG: hypothetical protein BWX69_03149 [Planctomycetes bacterium ADurb.Bin069]|nr:MAG: hypothetical protein BWX69_03149 [Planctomycetes bacterium ADurb.Bin069]
MPPPRDPSDRPRRLAAGAALEGLVRDTAGCADTEDLAALVATRDAQLALVTAAMQDARASVIDRGPRYALTLLGRTASSTVSAEAAILNWAIAARREWRAHSDRQAAAPSTGDLT